MGKQRYAIVLYLPRSLSHWIWTLHEEHELADVAWAVCCLLSSTVQGQVAGEMYLDEA